MAQLMALPAELRQRIFTFVDSPTKLITINIAQSCIHRLEPHGCSSLAALSLTSRTIHFEVEDQLYAHRTFEIEVVSSESILKLWRKNFAADMRFVQRMRRVRLGLTINTGSAKLARTVEGLAEVVGVLAGSEALVEFAVHVREVMHFAEPTKYVNEQIDGLKGEAVREGRKVGRSGKEVELDFAWRLVAFLQRYLG